MRKEIKKAVKNIGHEVHNIGHEIKTGVKKAVKVNRTETPKRGKK